MDDQARANVAFSCPSAQPDMEDVRVLGVIQYAEEGPRLAYLSGKTRLAPEDVQGVAPDQLGQVLRLTAKCENSRCGQFANGKCGLGARIAASLPDVVENLPSCVIRPSCRWYAEQGGAICRKCPQIVTQVSAEDKTMASVAIPPAA